MKKGFWIAVPLALLLLLIEGYLLHLEKSGPDIPFANEVAMRTDGGTKVAFFGDQGLREDSKAVLRLVKGEGVDLVVHLGDFDYQNNPRQWRRQIEEELGTQTPYLAILGNHEEENWNDYKDAIEEMRKNIPDLHCEGDITVDISCRYKGIHFVFSTPGLLRESVGSEKNLSHAAYVTEHFASSSSPWKVCGWHKNQRAMQVGEKTDETGWEIYEACRREGAIIATAHEHSYSRTHLLSSIANQTVAATTSPYTLRRGVSFVFVSGLGGESIRPQIREGDWWNTVYTSTQGAKSGALFCTFGTLLDPKKGKCYFKNIAGEVIDEFEIISTYEE